MPIRKAICDRLARLSPAAKLGILLPLTLVAMSIEGFARVVIGLAVIAGLVALTVGLGQLQLPVFLIIGAAWIYVIAVYVVGRHWSRKSEGK